MAGEASVWSSVAALNVLTGRVAYSTRTTYLALLTTAPTQATTMATMVEVAISGYNRQTITWTAPALPVDGSLYQSTNTAMTNFGPFLAPTTLPIVGAALVSASTGTTGDFIFGWTFSDPVFMATNETLQIPAGKLILAHR